LIGELIPAAARDQYQRWHQLAQIQWRLLTQLPRQLRVIAMNGVHEQDQARDDDQSKPGALLELLDDDDYQQAADETGAQCVDHDIQAPQGLTSAPYLIIG